MISPWRALAASPSAPGTGSSNYGWGPTSVLKDIKAPPKFFVACVLARSASPRHVYRPHPSAHMTHAMLDAGGGLDRHRSYLSSGIGFYAE